jgi:hypothetical protein
VLATVGVEESSEAEDVSLHGGDDYDLFWAVDGMTQVRKRNVWPRAMRARMEATRRVFALCTSA